MSIRESIIKRLETDQELPVAPMVVSKINNLFEKDSSTAEDIADVLQLDPALTAKVLRVSNSMAYRGLHEIASVPQAITHLGFREVRNIVLTFSLVKVFPQKGNVDYKMFWNHCLSVAFTAQVMNRHARKLSTGYDQAFTAGMLHDLGILILDMYAGQNYSRVSKSAKRKEISLERVEKEILGIDHAEVGSIFLQSWNLPESLVQAVRHHHQPLACNQEVPALTALVHLANFACNNQSIGNGVGIFPNRFSEKAWFDVGLSVDDIPAILEEVTIEAQKSNEVLSLA